MNSNYNQSHDPSAYGGIGVSSVAQASAEVRLNFIRKTYVLFMAGILTAIVSGAICLMTEPIFMVVASILNMPLLAFALIVGGNFAAQALARVRGFDFVPDVDFVGD